MEREDYCPQTNFTKVSKGLNANCKSHKSNRTNFSINSSYKISNISNLKTPTSNTHSQTSSISFGERLYRKSLAQIEVKELKIQKEIEKGNYSSKYTFKPILNDSNLSYFRVFILLN